ncbi:hypothetical protein J2786_002232 [Chryseobacterium vietnamense]|uniref:Uncharacterized protein n=1 Tax=Chryseobacterium vietnamense TaxID=866785 RepID=A0ACC6J7U7_9FLAO|nr:hypothetical protein [Chryseobacterium vietnamense]MDR6459125.1 hypothetical protein [Chryseobacterium vietnamense]
MLNELIERYSQYSDPELMEVYLNKNKYTDDAKQAIDIVIEKKGGIRSLTDRYDKIVAKEMEKSRIKNTAAELYLNGLTKNDINYALTSEVLASDEIQQIIENTSTEVEATKRDLEIKPSTIIGSILGGIIGGTIGGILWGLQIIYSGRIFYIFAIGLGIISYGFIKFFTKQSRNNIAVLTITILSVIYALILGFYIFELFGYHGPDQY